MEHRPEASGLMPRSNRSTGIFFACPGQLTRSETRVGSKPTVKGEDFTTEPFFHADPLFRIARRSVILRQVGSVI